MEVPGLPNHHSMIVGELPSAFRRPGQAFGLPNHHNMIVGELLSAFRRPGQAFGLPNHYNTKCPKENPRRCKF